MRMFAIKNSATGMAGILWAFYWIKYDRHLCDGNWKECCNSSSAFSCPFSHHVYEGSGQTGITDVIMKLGGFLNIVYVVCHTK